ncbi:apolipoprotein N-acyltransferase [Riemerella anatipestifer]|uniref:Apolipoprotein N-acyltransferase n=1 Tax=Riemerella anatipestifer TaxID=34085 RepID=A0AAP6HD76_RIEAN|nr:apolipoprotein N-acyltransferase [Riemerella anatipestifer]MBT0548760.1 apolipoprotein N-acyltransferase [Riemerella anatipestifer]MBT0555073.1 apolipoprotein N-acyltransferase [Riemerella anatipestifer]MBT0559523.1 apolipoprotein N-acyltransferase [Riemerella anatipestifer]MCD5968352.1 apolipoprotein N-acyltransferase [Riemerella anatipestifer]MCO7354908.1 apolipoprotein N-acyltransferase [Riemerella anatipestifer]
MKYIVLALISGLLFSVSWPTYGVPFFIFFAFVPLLMVEHDISKFSSIKRKGWAVFGSSYLAFLVWNSITTGWLYEARNPDGSHAVFAVLFPVLVNSLLMSLAFQCYHLYKNAKSTYWGLAFFIVVWMAFEKFHLEWEFSWPWLHLGNAFADYPKLIQWYDTLGATGGSFWILIINVLAFYALRIWEAGRVRKDLIKNISIVSAVIVVPMLISLAKYHNFNEKPIGKVRAMMLQPDLNPYTEKYQKDSLQIVDELLHLAKEYQTSNIDFYLAPETAFPGYGGLSEKGLKQSTLIKNVEDYLNHQPKSVFVGGVSTYNVFYNENEAPKTASYYPSQGIWVENYNSAIQIAPSLPYQLYHKAKLVPGVEIFPYISVLKPLLGEAMLNFGGTISSLGMDKERAVFANPYNKGKIAPIICYESIYGEFVTDYVKKGANFLGILTNDSWWGVTQGHRQLLAYAKLRAIETRREVARSANSGISAHIDARGEIVADTFYGDQTTLVADINLYDGTTFYTRTGDLLSRISIFVLGFLVCYLVIEKLMSKTPQRQK